ncbi:BAG family molecular chaperone regulator 1-like [Homarus americanus]|uniref:BAG family molecular chaperone regulator 1-like n=1 Tax=Homarus americanus TaxID=6706 RepID=A0A8J5JZY0_HOMAM|nr:BAG family molecular chaperone regulator 1-like [Homarus americanus]
MWLFGRFMRQNPAKMGDQEYHILLCHGPNKYEIVIETVTHILQSNQKILFKGKNLTDCNMTLASYGVGPGMKVMVLGKKFDPEDDLNYQAVVQDNQNQTPARQKRKSVVKRIQQLMEKSDQVHENINQLRLKYN